MPTLASYRCGMLSPVQVQLLQLLLPPMHWVVQKPRDIPSYRQHPRSLPSLAYYPDSCPHNGGRHLGITRTGVYLGILSMFPPWEPVFTITLCRGVTAGYTATPDQRHMNMIMHVMLIKHVHM